VKISRVLLLALALCLAAASVSLAENNKKIIYQGEVSRQRWTNSTTNVYREMDKNSQVLATYNSGKKLSITDVYPGWVEIRMDGGGTGYVLRHRIDVTGNTAPGVTPDYPIWPMSYYAVIDRTVNVKAEKDAGSDTLSVLTDGARIAIEGFEDGWAVVIHKRVYGYIDTRDLKEVYPVAGSVETADADTPLSVFSSFYSDNPDRIVNLGVCCNFISHVLLPGQTMNFNNEVSPFSAANGYRLAPVLVDGETKMGYGGGSCQVSSTLWDTLMQLPGITVLHRNPHGDNAASYLPHGMDAASGTPTQNFIFRNDYDFPIRIEASTHDLAMFIAIYKEI